MDSSSGQSIEGVIHGGIIYYGANNYYKLLLLFFFGGGLSTGKGVEIHRGRMHGVPRKDYAWGDYLWGRGWDYCTYGILLCHGTGYQPLSAASALCH